MPNASRFNIKIDKGLSHSWIVRCQTDSGVSAIDEGTPIKLQEVDASRTGDVILMVDGDGTTSQLFAGICKTNSSHTSSVAGLVDAWFPTAGMLYRAGALVAANADTQAEIEALSYKRVVLDVTADIWTVDSAAADALVNCVVITGGNPLTSELEFVYSLKGTSWDSSTAVT